MEVHAHCDGPCGVYDPASSRIAAEAVLAMTKKLIALTHPASTNSEEWAAYSNTFSRFVAVKEEQAKETKKEILILWTDYFKPVHLESYPDLHETIWKAAKLCSACKVSIDLAQAEDGIRDCLLSRGLGDVYKRQLRNSSINKFLASPNLPLNISSTAKCASD